MENWLVQQLRFSAFVPAASPGLLSTIWPLISTDSPESDESRPRDGFRRMAAPDADSVLEAATLPGRFDIIKSQAASAEIQPNIHFGDASTQLEAFAEKIRSMFNGLSEDIQFQRLALGVVLVRPVASREAAYAELGKLLPLEPDPATSRDFLYQINHPEMFAHGSGTIELNRLSRWSAMRAQRFTFQIAHDNATGGPAPSQMGLSSGENFVRCEIDNSSTAADVLPRDSWHPIFNRLIELAHITAGGECREAS